MELNIQKCRWGGWVYGQMGFPFSARHEGVRVFPLELWPVVMGVETRDGPGSVFSKSIIKAQSRSKKFHWKLQYIRSFDQELHTKFQIEVLK